MSVEEELHEHAEHAKEPFDKRVAITMAIIAALLAIVSVLGHVLTTEELLAQQKASDQWAYSQAKDIRRYDSEIARDMMKALKGPDADAGAEHYSANAEKYKKDHDDIQDKATEFEKERDHKGAQALRLETSEVFFEVGIVFASLAILSKRAAVWYLSMLMAVIGVAIAATAQFVG
jgi:Domain of unknown function (DUF4337)